MVCAPECVLVYSCLSVRVCMCVCVLGVVGCTPCVCGMQGILCSCVVFEVLCVYILHVGHDCVKCGVLSLVGEISCYRNDSHYYCHYYYHE